MNKPLIGITKPDGEDLFEFAAIWLSVIMAGGQTRLITPLSKNYADIDFDGLVLGGGKDIFPELYNQSPKKEYTYNKGRDDMELLLATKARDNNIPVLGICRGAQVLNVACGGDLHASVSEEYEDAHYPDGLLHNIFYRKEIFIHNNCLLNDITRQNELKVNSIHKQAIATLGTDLEIDAQENNGVIQAISMPKHLFFLGVQFHPEFLIYAPVFRRIFKALVSAAESAKLQKQ